MGLSQAQKAILEKARASGSGGQAVQIGDAGCNYVIGVVATDLGFAKKFPELGEIPGFFTPGSLRPPARLGEHKVTALFERLVSLDKDADTYFACLSALYKGRLKYDVILKTQAFPS
jgi:hypothetical protein